MKIVCPIAYGVALVIGLKIHVDIKIYVLLAAIVSIIYLLWGCRRAITLGCHPLNEGPNALRLFMGILGGFITGYGFTWHNTLSIVLGVLLILSSIVFNDETARRLYRRLFPHGGFSLALLGIDGSGKSTYSREIAKLYKNYGAQVYIVPYHRYLFLDKLSKTVSSMGKSRPSKTTILRYFYYYDGRVKRVVRLFLSLIDNLVLYLLFVMPKIIRGRVVILDRFLWSTYVKYWALRYPVKSLRRLWFMIKPHYAIIFDIPGTTSYKRILERDEHIRYPPCLLEAERKYYLHIAKRYGYPVIDTTKPFNETLKRVNEIVLTIFLWRKRK